METYSDSDSSSYSSDDDYLTTSRKYKNSNKNGSSSSSNPVMDGKTAEEEREAIIRRKLMESFYGSSDAAPDNSPLNVVTSTTNSNVEKSSSSKSPQKNENQQQARGNSSSSSSNSNRHDSKSKHPSSTSPSNKQTTLTTPSSSKHPQQGNHESVQEKSTNTNFNLNSPTFSAYNHTRSLLLTSNTENLLQHNETLALNVRHLDSTMQTLVYENYSKFIDATDAVRSINESVDHSAENGLLQLQSSIQTIQTSNTHVNSEVHVLRSKVAEKLEIKHHLERLEHLLNLPTSLQNCIQKQNFRLAVKRHAQAAMILGRHSSGFESLIKIEGECRGIMEEMMMDLMGKLLSWSGRGRDYLKLKRGLALEEEKEEGKNEMDIINRQYSDLDDSDLEDNDEVSNEEKEFEEDNNETKHLDLPPLPKSVADIFECAGSFDILTPQQSQTLLGPYAKHFTSDTCKVLVLDAIECMLERDLDRHRMDLMGAFMDDLTLNNLYDKDDLPMEYEMERLMERATSASSGRAREVLREQLHLDQKLQRQKTPSKLQLAVTNGSNMEDFSIVPTQFLDKMLNTCTLFGVTFSHSTSSNDDAQLLHKFVNEMFSIFLTQMKTDLFELSSNLDDFNDERNNTTTVTNTTNTDNNNNNNSLKNDNGQHDDFELIANALTHLNRSTRELASGLALPEIGIDMELASGLVDQTMELTESMIRRYVSIRFYALRNKAVKDCIAPFVQEVVKGTTATPTSRATTASTATSEVTTTASGVPSNKEGKVKESSTSSVADIIRLATIAVAEMMQLADSKIEEVTGILMSAPVESDMVRLAVQKNSCQFALWLASAFEVLAGCDTIIVSGSDKIKMLHLPNETEELDENGTDTNANMKKSTTNQIVDEDMSVVSFTDVGEDDREDPIHMLVMQIEDLFVVDAVFGSRMILALAQVCRMAEKSVIETINSSIGSSMNSDSNEKDPRGRFAFNTQGVDVDANGIISRRFQNASERILALYATDQGTAAANIACNNIHSDGSNGVPIPVGPRSCMFDVLELAKITSIDCATIMGGSAMAVPMKPFEEEDNVFNHYSGMANLGLGGTMAGVQLDVERMFAQKTTIFKDTVEFDRDKVLCAMFMIAFKAIIERIRSCTVSFVGYRQMRVDVELFRHMVPHYVSADFTGPLFNLLDDIMMNVLDRCLDKETVGDGSEFYDENDRMHLPADILRDYMDDKKELAAKFVISEGMIAG